ncbi:CG42822, partial [Drosophila busckii]
MKFWLISLLACLALSQVHACTAPCPDTEELVWAVGPRGGGGCMVFRNMCHFTKANCTRKPPLTEVTKEECQKRCPSICPQNYDPVSGFYKGQERKFGNACEMSVHTCQTGES